MIHSTEGSFRNIATMSHILPRLRDSKSGFNPIELLVVVCMIGILIAMLLPAVQQIRDSVRRVSCQNNLMQIGTAIKHYETAFDHLPQLRNRSHRISRPRPSCRWSHDGKPPLINGQFRSGESLRLSTPRMTWLDRQ